MECLQEFLDGIDVLGINIEVDIKYNLVVTDVVTVATCRHDYNIVEESRPVRLALWKGMLEGSQFFDTVTIWLKSQNSFENHLKGHDRIALFHKPFERVYMLL